MREIKFRVWEVRENKMYYNLAFYNDNLSSVMTNEKPLIEVIPMQFIGLKDKNNNEIYEGDIVKVNNQYSIIEFREGGFYCNNSDYCLNTIWFQGGNPLVVGNIYENKIEEFI